MDEKDEQKYDRTNRANEEKMERRKIEDGEKKKKIRIKRNTKYIERRKLEQ